MNPHDPCKLLLLLFAATSATSSLSKMPILSSPPSKSGLVDAAVQILESCYKNRTTAVGIAGSSADLIISSLWTRGSRQVTLINSSSSSSSQPMKNGPTPRNRHKLQVFLVTASSSSTLKKTLDDLRSSIWWNHLAAFLILDTSSHDCKNAHEILWSAWDSNLLNAKFLCLLQTDRFTSQRLIYTFNPYTSRAPPPWKLHQIHPGKNDHPWTLFVRSFNEAIFGTWPLGTEPLEEEEEEEDEAICKNLDFERADDLGGYEIGVSVTSFGADRVASDSGRICFGVYEGMHCEVLFEALNATPRVLVHSLNSIGYVDGAGNPNGILAEVVNGTSDIGLTGRILSVMENLTFVYPHWLCEIRALTRYSGSRSQLSKIRSVVDGTARSGLCLVLLATILFFRYVDRQTLAVAHLNTVRVICNSTLPRMPRRVAPRIYLGSLFLFALTIQGIYQGKFASLLTKQQPLRNVNTMSDLIELGHTVYGFTNYRSHFDDPSFEGRFVELHDVVCTGYVLSTSRAACVAATSDLIYDAAAFNLHISRDTLTTIYEAFPIRPDWPLEDRVNRIVRRSLESYWMQRLYDNVTGKTVRLIKMHENRHVDQSARVLTLEQLTFAFGILAIGLGVAAVCFVVEVGAADVRLEILKTMKRLLCRGERGSTMRSLRS